MLWLGSKHELALRLALGGVLVNVPLHTLSPLSISRFTHHNSEPVGANERLPFPGALVRRSAVERARALHVALSAAAREHPGRGEEEEERRGGERRERRRGAASTWRDSGSPNKFSKFHHFATDPSPV